jgi:hypothetical protein
MYHRTRTGDELTEIDAKIAQFVRILREGWTVQLTLPEGHPGAGSEIVIYAMTLDGSYRVITVDLTRTGRPPVTTTRLAPPQIEAEFGLRLGCGYVDMRDLEEN